MSHKRLVTGLRLRAGPVAIGLAAAVILAPASFAQGPPEDRPTLGEMSGGLRLDTPEPGGVSVATPIGKVWVGAEVLEGEPSYVRRTTDGKGITIVEVSNTPFMPVLASNGAASQAELLRRQAELPAGW